MPLNDKQKRFCEEYVGCYNGTKAYQAAYGVSYDCAKAKAYLLLRKPEIREYLTELERDNYEANRINAEHLANELSSIAFAEKGDVLYTANQKLKALELLQKQLGLQTQKVEVDATTINVKIEE